MAWQQQFFPNCHLTWCSTNSKNGRKTKRRDAHYVMLCVAYACRWYPQYAYLGTNVASSYGTWRLCKLNNYISNKHYATTCGAKCLVSIICSFALKVTLFELPFAYKLVYFQAAKYFNTNQSTEMTEVYFSIRGCPEMTSLFLGGRGSAKKWRKVNGGRGGLGY